jgi:Mn-dependent DtxR family transcriptional regulator
MTLRTFSTQEIRREIAAFFGKDRKRRWWLQTEVADRLAASPKQTTAALNTMTTMGLLERESFRNGKHRITAYRRKEMA